MSRPVLSPVTHAQAAEHRRAFSLLADPIYRRGIKLRLRRGFDSDTEERLLVAQNEVEAAPDVINEIELRLPHPNLSLSAPRLVTRVRRGGDVLGTSTVAYYGHGIWAMELSDITSFATPREAEDGSLVWKLIEAKKSLDERALRKTVSELGALFLDPAGGMAPSVAANHRSHDLESYWLLRSLMGAHPMQRHASGHSVRGLPGRFLRSPVLRNAHATAVFEIRKPNLHENYRTAPSLTLHMGRQQPDLFSVTITPTMDRKWIMVSEVRAVSAEDLDFMKGMYIEPGTHILEGGQIPRAVDHLFFLYSVITKEDRP